MEILKEVVDGVHRENQTLITRSYLVLDKFASLSTNVEKLANVPAIQRVIIAVLGDVGKDVHILVRDVMPKHSADLAALRSEFDALSALSELCTSAPHTSTPFTLQFEHLFYHILPCNQR